jgi:transcriptional regulator with XRE-family HTH domain
MFGERLRALRREKGLSQGELADLAGINRSYLSVLENGRSSPTIEVVEKLAHGLNVSVWDLIASVEEKHFDYEGGEVLSMHDGLKEFLSDEDEMMLTQPTSQEIETLRSIRLKGIRPDKRFFRDALLAYRRNQKSSSSPR